MSKEQLIEIARSFPNKEDLSLKNLILAGVTRHDVRRHFGTLGVLHSHLGVELKRRSSNMTREEMKKFIKQIAVVTPAGCWETAKLSTVGESKRNQIYFESKSWYLYRLSYTIFKKEIDPPLCILHSCDNERCFNPDHLEEGTPLKNSQDRHNRGRHKGGPLLIKRKHKLKDPYDFTKLLDYLRSIVRVSPKGEWLYPTKNSSYAKITINRRTYAVHRLVLANKLSLKYDQIDRACHKFPITSPFSLDKPNKNDVNPEHLYNGSQSQNLRDTLPYNKNVKITSELRDLIQKNLDSTKFTTAGAAPTFDAVWASKCAVSLDTIRKIRTVDKSKKGTNKKAIIQLDCNNRFIRRFESAKEAATELGIYDSAINHVLAGRSKTYKGFIWKYA